VEIWTIDVKKLSVHNGSLQFILWGASILSYTVLCERGKTRLKITMMFASDSWSISQGYSNNTKMFSHSQGRIHGGV